MVLVVKNPPASAGDIRNVGSIPGLGRSPGGRNDNPLQYSCLGNPVDREACYNSGYNLKGREESDMARQLSIHTNVRYIASGKLLCSSEDFNIVTELCNHRHCEFQNLCPSIMILAFGNH